MRITTVIAALLQFLLLGVVLSACLQDYGPTGRQRVEVGIAVRDAATSAGQNFATGQGILQIGTSLIIAVPDGTAATPRFELIDTVDVLAQGLLDLATSSILLSLPAGTDIQLFEYTFNDTLTLDKILANPPIAGDPNVSTPFTVSLTDTDANGVVNLTISLPLQTTSFTETFAATALDSTLWETAIGDVTVGAGEAAITASAAESALPSEQRQAGVSSRIRNNRNLLLNSQRVAGTIRIDNSLESDFGPNPQAAQNRAHAQLIYRTRASRGSGDDTGVSIARVELFAASDGVTARLQGGFCISGDCFDPGEFTGFDAAHTAELILNPIAGFPSADFPFSLEYRGDGVFLATFAGATGGIDMSDLAGFDDNHFLFADLRTQGRFVFDPGDTADVTAAYRNIEIGDPAFDPTATVKLADNVLFQEDFFGNFYDPALWVDGINSSEQISAGEFALNATGFGEYKHEMDMNAPAGPLHQADVRVDSFSGPFAISLTGRYYSDGTGDVEVSLTMAETGAVEVSIESCVGSDNCIPIGSPIPLGTINAAVNNTLVIAWDGAQTFLLSAGTTIIQSSVTGPTNAGLATFPERGLDISADLGTGGTFTAAIDNVLLDDPDGAGPLPQTVHDNFNSGTFDSTKWFFGGPSQRQVAGKNLTMSQLNSQPELSFIDTLSPDAMAADVTVSAQTGDGKAILAKVLFVESNAEIIGAVGMSGTNATGLLLRCLATAGDCTVMTTVALGATALNSTHTLFLQWDGSLLTFQLDADTPQSLDPVAFGATIAGPPTAGEGPGGPIVGNFNLLSGPFFSQGSITATYDNIRAGKAVTVP